MLSIGPFSKRRLLVVETDGFSLRAVVIRAGGGRVRIERMAQSRVPQFAGALEEAVAQLRREGLGLPRQAVLLTPMVVPVLLELPVHPQHPRPAAQMRELIRWELEPHLAQQLARHPIGSILIGRGYLDDGQARMVLGELDRRRRQAEIEQRQRKQGGVAVEHPTGKWRFGEVAFELGFITQEQLQECLAIQGEFSLVDDEPVVAWSSASESLSDVKKHLWLACGISRSVRDQWSRIFAGHGLSLWGIYPLAGCCSAALGREVGGEPTAVLELHQGLVACTILAEGKIVEMQVRQGVGRVPSAEQCIQMIGRAKRIWLAGAHPSLRAISEELSNHFREEIGLMATAGEGAGGAMLAAHLAAACHALRLPGGHRAVCIPGDDPPLPLRQRPAIRWVMAGGVAALFFLGVEASLQVRMSRAVTAKERAEQKLSRVQEEFGRIESLVQKAKELEGNIAKLKRERDELEKRRLFLEEVLPAHTQYLPLLMDYLAGGGSDELAICRVAWTAKEELQMTCWSMSERAAQEFAARLVALHGWPNEVEQRIKAEVGRLGLPGYRLELRVGGKRALPWSDSVAGIQGGGE